MHCESIGTIGVLLGQSEVPEIASRLALEVATWLLPAFRSCLKCTVQLQCRCVVHVVGVLHLAKFSCDYLKSLKYGDL